VNVFENEFIRQGILFGNESRMPVRSGSMGAEVPKILRKFFAETQLGQSEFARLVGVSQGTVSKWLSGSQSPNKKQWDAVEKLIRDNPKTASILPTAVMPWITEVPIISWVSAGALIGADSQIAGEDTPKAYFSDLGAGDFFALKVSGDSMDRVSPDGSVIVVNRLDRRLQPGKPFVFWHRTEGTTYKLWQSNPDRLEPHSWNAVNKAIFTRRKREFEVIGRVRRTVLDL
jgi:SOS-response transcriptional repressor LexA